MAEEIIKRAREDIERGKKQLEEARILIDRLKRAGEDTLELERRYNEVKRKLERYEQAFRD